MASEKPVSGLTNTEREQAAKLLSAASEEFGNHGCNDYELPNTDEGWAMICAMEDWNGTRSEDRSPRPPLTKPIFTADFFVMGYLAHRIKTGA